MTDEPYVISDERLAAIRTLLDEDKPAPFASKDALAAAVYDLLSERDDRTKARQLTSAEWVKLRLDRFRRSALTAGDVEQERRHLERFVLQAERYAIEMGWTP